jgi:hypothetical protein
MPGFRFSALTASICAEAVRLQIGALLEWLKR